MTTRRYTGNYDGEKYKDMLKESPVDYSKASNSRSDVLTGMNQGEKQGGGLFGGGGVGMNLFGGMGGGKKKSLAKEQMMEKLTGKTTGIAGETIYERAIREKMDAVKNAKLGEKIQGLMASDETKGMMNKFMSFRKKQKAGENQKVSVTPTSFRNGKIDALGSITTHGGRRVGYVDTKTGWVKSNMGMRLLKYDPKSMNLISDLERMVENFRLQNRRMNSGNDGGHNTGGTFM